MPTEERIKRDIEKILTNGFEIDPKTKKKIEYPKLLPEQIEVIRNFKEYYESKPSSKGGKIKIYTIWNSLCVLRRYGLFIKKPFKQATKEDNIEWVKSINGCSSATISAWKVIIGGFYKWLYSTNDKFPEAWNDPLFKPEIVKTTRTPKMMLTQEEIKKMLDVAQTYKAKSLIMLSFGEGSLRGGEIVSCNVEDYEPDTRGMKLWIRKSKSKQRYVRLIDTEPFLREYLNREHEFKTDLNYPLFYSKQYGKKYGIRSSTQGINNLLQRIARKAGITKRIFTHLGRHNSITNLKKMGMDSSLLAKRCGITISTLERVYLHTTDKDVDDAYLKLKGKDQNEELERIKEEQKKLEIKICPRCKERFPNKPEIWKHPSTNLYCSCGFCLDQRENDKYLEEIQKGEKELNNFFDHNSIQELFKLVIKLQKQINILKEKS